MVQACDKPAQTHRLTGIHQLRIRRTCHCAMP